MSQKYSRKQELKNVMTDAVDGSGIAHWAEVKGVRRDWQGFVTSFLVRDTEFDDGSRISEKWVTVNAASLLSGIQKLLTGDVVCRRDLAAQFIGKEYVYDQEGIDVVVQAIVFNELAYG